MLRGSKVGPASLADSNALPLLRLLRLLLCLSLLSAGGCRGRGIPVQQATPLPTLLPAATLDDPNLVATVFAPNNDGIARTLRDGGATQAQLLENTQLLRTLLSYHVVPGRAFKVGGQSAVVGAGCELGGGDVAKCWRLLPYHLSCASCNPLKPRPPCSAYPALLPPLLQAADLKQGLKFRTLQGGEFAVDEVDGWVGDGWH